MKSVLITFCESDEFNDVCEISTLSKVMFNPCTVIVEPVTFDPFVNLDSYLLTHNLLDDSVILEKLE